MELSVPDESYFEAARLAREQDIPVGEVFAAALSEQLALLKRLEARAARGDRAKFLTVLDKASDVPEKLD